MRWVIVSTIPAATPHNPWDLTRNPGISSSGSAAATAAFLCAASLGEDTGGSIRIPAAWSGLVGLRPTWGLVSRYGVLPACWSMDTVGPITRTVEDCAITLQAIAGYDPKDAYSRNAPVPDYRAALYGGVTNLRVGVIKEKVYGDDVDPEVRDAVIASVGALGELGASVEEVSLPLIEAGGVASKGLTDMEAAAVHYENLKSRPGDYDYNSRVRLLTAILTPAQMYNKAQKIRELLTTADPGTAGKRRRAGLALITRSSPQDSRRTRHQEPGRRPERHIRRQELHGTLQPGRSPGHIGPLRIHVRRPPHIPPNRRPPL